MKMTKMALLAGAAIAVTGAAAHADELQDLKAQMEVLNARVAAMETAPAVPAGYKLLTVSKGEALQVPGLDQSNQDRFSQGNRSTIISVMPTADAPAGTTISWSGYVRAAIVYTGNDDSAEFQRSTRANTAGSWTKGTGTANHEKFSNNTDDWDVKARGQLRVVATTDTAVGEVGVELKLRADMNGNGSSDVYVKTAWGYWAMTPELTLGGGYSGSLGNIGYGYDGACSCYYTDNADVGFDPGDTTQMRLSYVSGPFSAAVAIEDASLQNGDGENDKVNSDNLGAAGEIKYSGDSFSGEISGVYRAVNGEDYDSANLGYNADVDNLWQIGAGVGFNLGDIASISLAAAMGEGPYQTVNDSTGNIDNSFGVNNQWWGVSGLATANLSDTVHAEAGAGYKHREGDDFKTTGWNYDGFEYDTYAFLGGLYYTPVDQLTIGLEGEWFTQSWDFERTDLAGTTRDTLDVDRDNWTVDLVSVWRF
ncbi:hypothetical protein [Aestuariivirga sp.]|uniref:hypothetical protein n=1 Tax=Aestuariivirga sp. TaxID=2650926 RepID=UPI003BACDB30